MYDYHYAEEYCKKWLEIIDYFRNRKGDVTYRHDIVFKYDGFSITCTKDFNSFKYNNHRDDRSNLIFRYVKIKTDDFDNWSSLVFAEYNEILLKMDYFDNNTVRNDFKLHTGSHEYEVEQVVQDVSNMRDEGYMFQQSVLMGERELFGTCCMAWMKELGAKNMYSVSELPVHVMFEIYDEVFKK